MVPLVDGSDNRTRKRLAAVSPRSLERICKAADRSGPEPGSTEDSSCVPPANQPSRPLSKPGLLTRFRPPSRNTWTLSKSASPASISSTCKFRLVLVGGKLLVPLSRIPRYSSVTHELFCVSSLSAQTEASSLSLAGSTNSRLLPPPSAHFGQRPPVP